MPDLRNAFAHHQLPLARWLQHATDRLVNDLSGFFRAVRYPVAETLSGFSSFLGHLPVWVFLLVTFALSWRLISTRFAFAAAGSLLLVGFVGMWDYAMTTVAMVVTSVVFCIVTGVPLGVAAAKNDRFERVLRPLLDAMQTLPTFVYLVPIVIFFGIGTVPGVMATIIVALPPIIRLTSLGIRQVDPAVVEAGYSFGSSRLQVLREVELPLALPSIMAGVNQTLLLSLSMVVMVALIGGGGLGFQVYQGINQLDIGLAGTSGISVVVLAILFDRLTQSAVKPRRELRLRRRAAPEATRVSTAA
jgi:glycine betaine/proline transport system permease protein